VTKAQAVRQAVCHTPLSLRDLVHSPAPPAQSSGMLRKMLSQLLFAAKTVATVSKMEYRAPEGGVQKEKKGPIAKVATQARCRRSAPSGA